MKRFHACLSLIAVLVLSPLALKAQQGPDPGDNKNPELLKDEFLYQFNGDKPALWTVVGESSQLSGRDTYNSSTGHAVRIQTKGTTGFLEQIVDLSKEYKFGDEFEGLLHYSVEFGAPEEGALRLAMKWLDASGNELTEANEKKFINNEKLWFSHMRSWGTLRFRARLPQGAKRFRFAVEVNKQSNVRLDDFSFRKQDNPTPFVSVLPQITRFIEVEVGKSLTQHYVVQSYNQKEPRKIELTEGIPFSANLKELNSGDSVVDLEITCKPTEAGKVPRGRQHSQASIDNGSGYTLNIPLQVYSIDPKNPPTAKVPAIQPFTYTLGTSGIVNQEISLEFEHMIDDVTLAIEPAGKGFNISTTNIKYFEKAYPPLKIGVNNTKIRIGFKNQTLGEVDAHLVISSPMFETQRIPLKGIVKQGEVGWKEKFSKRKFPAKSNTRYSDMEALGYYWFDKGIWTMFNNTIYEPDTQEIFFYGDGAELRYEGGFSDGLIYSEDFPNGIATVKVKAGSYAAPSAMLALEVSYDHGGAWHRIGDPKAVQEGKEVIYTINSHQPTTFRLVRTNGGEAEGVFIISEVSVEPSEAKSRLVHSSLVELVDFSKDKAQARLVETFDNELHHGALSIDGWRNLAFAGNCPWVSYQQRMEDSGTLNDEDVAKVTLYKATPQDGRELTAFLVSPLLNYQDAKTKELTFRLFKQTALEQDKFFVYVAPVKNGKIGEVLLLPIEHFTPGGKLSERVWYDYLLKLNEFDGLDALREFVVIFALQSPLGSNETSTVYLLDDFGWGREDNAVISVDKKVLPFYQLQAAPISLEVTTKNARESVRTMLISANNSPQVFKLDKPTLPAAGGTLSVSIDRQKLASKPRDYGTRLFLSTRGGQNLEVLLFATPKTEQEVLPTEEVKPDAYTYRRGNEVVVSAPGLLSVEAYDLSGQQLSVGRGPADELVLSVPAQASRIVLRLIYTDGSKQTIKM
ncbi:MAG: hypothetical protein Q4A64_02125 [Porphyromonadaceae bacterium]|nr:hypothetical protein [Porphyromonadaceae bacterium]